MRAYLGIPYAAPPTGPNRWRSPQPVAPWQATRAATAVGPVCPQSPAGNQHWLNPPGLRQSEDCLTLNVWAPAAPGPWPVLVWLHGGQTRHGSANGPATDGAALAARGLVVVTVNYRLGALGGLAHPALRDPGTGWCANWGLQDKLAALRWVQRSIAAFGGDPGCVTLAGQSSGAANAALIAQNGLAAGHLHRLILHSPPLFRPPMFAELDTAAAYTEAFAAWAGLDLGELRRADGPSLQAAEHRFAQSAEVRARLGRPHTAPVRDGIGIRAWSYDAPPPDVPLLAGWTRHEADFWFDLRDAEGECVAPLSAPTSIHALRAALDRLIGQHYAFADAPTADVVMHAYAGPTWASLSPAAIPRLWQSAYTDLVFRAPIQHLLNRPADAHPGRTWAFAFAHPVVRPAGSVPHACDVPLVFGTHAHPWFDGKIAPGAPAVSARVMQAWARFARAADPGPDWPAYGRMHQKVRILADPSRITTTVGEDAGQRCWRAYTASGSDTEAASGGQQALLARAMAAPGARHAAAVGLGSRHGVKRR